MSTPHIPMSVDEATAQPGMADKIAAARARNEQDFATAAEVGAEAGLNHGQLNQALRVYRQLIADGRFTGSFEAFVEQRIADGIVRPGA